MSVTVDLLTLVHIPMVATALFAHVTVAAHANCL